MKKNMVKVLLGMCMLVAFAFLPMGKVSVQASTKSAAKKAFKQYMKTQPSYTKYKIVDITGDDIPELIIRVPKKKAGTLNSNKFTFFSYNNGSLVNITTFYEKYKSLYYYKGSNVVVAKCFPKKNHCTYEYFKMTNKKAKLLAYSYYLKGKRHYVFKDVYRLKPAFDKRMAKATGNAKLVAIKFK